MRCFDAPARALVHLLVACLILAGCGGGSDAPAVPMRGATSQTAISSRINGTTYPLSVYLPPASAGARATLPIVYALDGDWWFQTLVDIAEATRADIIVVAVGNAASRAHDYVPQNRCTANGGGHGAYLDFIRQELIPLVEGTIGGDPQRRALLGHSHGGSFVFYALLAEASGTHRFSAYLASDASIGCMPEVVEQWEAAYALVNADLPVRLHVSYASGNVDNATFAQRLSDRRYPGLALRAQAYSGTHTGIIPAAFADALAFAFSD